MEPIADVEGQLRREKPGEPAAGSEYEVESRVLFGYAPAEVRIERTAGEFDVWSQPVESLEQPFDLRGESRPVRQLRLLKLDIDDFRADHQLSPNPAPTDRIRQDHCPGGHHRRAALLRAVLVRQPMRQQIAGAQRNLLCADSQVRDGVFRPA